MIDFETVLMGIAFLVGLVALALWGWMVVDCFRHRDLGKKKRLAWLLAIVCGKFVGAGAYYLLRYRPRTSLPARALEHASP